MHSLPALQLDTVSSSGFVYHERTQFIRRNEFRRICSKSGSDGQEKSEEELIFIGCGASVLWPKKIGYGKMRNSLIIPTCIMKPKDFLRSVILIIALSAFGISSGVTSDKNEAKHSSKITKARAERIALTKVPGGSIRSAELETARGRRFWSVYIAKPGSKNAKEIRVDATSGQILAVQTERPEDQAEEPPKTH
jgi:hypothetical protein